MFTILLLKTSSNDTDYSLTPIPILTGQNRTARIILSELCKWIIKQALGEIKKDTYEEP